MCVDVHQRKSFSCLSKLSAWFSIWTTSTPTALGLWNITKTLGGSTLITQEPKKLLWPEVTTLRTPWVLQHQLTDFVINWAKVTNWPKVTMGSPRNGTFSILQSLLCGCGAPRSFFLLRKWSPWFFRHVFIDLGPILSQFAPSSIYFAIYLWCKQTAPHGLLQWLCSKLHRSGWKMYCSRCKWHRAAWGAHWF